MVTSAKVQLVSASQCLFLISCRYRLVQVECASRTRSKCLYYFILYHYPVLLFLPLIQPFLSQVHSVIHSIIKPKCNAPNAPYLNHQKQRNVGNSITHIHTHGSGPWAQLLQHNEEGKFHFAAISPANPAQPSQKLE